MSQSLKICVLCLKPAELLCPRCYDSYCSVECQKADWKAHRQICFRMPILVSNAEIFEQKVVEPLNKLNVVEKPQSTPPRPSQIKEKPKTPSPKILKVKESEIEMPGLVKKREDAPKEVKMEEKVPEAKIKPVQQEKIFQKSAPAKRLEVPEVADFPSPKPIPKPKKEEVQAENAKTEVEKPTKAMKLPVFNRGPMKIAAKEEPPKLLMMEDLKMRVWPESKNIKTKIITALDKTVLTLTEDNESIPEYYNYIAEEIANYCKKNLKPDETYLPVKGEVVLALFEEGWYRAQVLDPSEKGTIVQYIEYGNVATLQPSEMRAMPTKMSFEVCARDFIIENMPEDLTEKQLEILSSHSITITGVRKVDGVWNCKILGF